MYHDYVFPPEPFGQGQSVSAGFGPRRDPPSEFVRSCAELKLWLKLARPNEERAYAAGFVLAQSCSATLRDYVMTMAELGFLTPHRMRGLDGVPVYIVKRTRRAIIEGQL